MSTKFQSTFMNSKLNYHRFGVTLAFVSFLTFFLASGQSAFSQTGGSDTKLSLPGLKQPVTVRRDERGIPYISAQNDEDLYFAQGYATASDRLWQMDLLRRTARG